MGFWDVASSLFSPVTNFVSSLFTNSSNRQSVESTNATNMAMNTANIDFQKAENAIARQREDNAVQRRVNDLTAAGLSKTLAAGSPASANAMNAPNYSFASQAPHAEAPRFDFDYASTKQSLANADALRTNAEAAMMDAKTRQKAQYFEMIKFAKQHGLDLNKFGLDVDKFEYDKEMRSKEFELDKWLKEESLSLEKDKFKLSKDEFVLKREQLDEVIKNSISEREYRAWTMTYQEACYKLDKIKDDRQAEMFKYDVLEIKARLLTYLDQHELNTAQLRFVKKNTQKVVSEIVSEYAKAMNLSADTQKILEQTISEVYDRSIAESEGTTTGGHVVSSSEAHQNALDRASEQEMAGTASMRQFFSIVLFALFGVGKNGFKIP